MFQRRCVLGIKDDEARAVKTGKAADGAPPKVTVVTLRDGLHRILWQSLIRLPGARAVLHHGIGGTISRENSWRKRPKNQSQPVKMGATDMNGELHGLACTLSETVSGGKAIQA